MLRNPKSVEKVVFYVIYFFFTILTLPEDEVPLPYYLL